jgi:hypothetical protein
MLIVVRMSSWPIRLFIWEESLPSSIMKAAAVWRSSWKVRDATPAAATARSDPRPEVVVAEEAPARRGEHPLIAREGGQVPGETFAEEVGYLQCPAGRRCLSVVFDHGIGAVGALDGANDADGGEFAGPHIEVGPAQAREFLPAAPAIGGRVDQGLVTILDATGQTLDLFLSREQAWARNA